MKKSFIYLTSILLIGFAIFTQSCTKTEDNTIKTSDITGKVTYPDGAADGAIVVLSTEANAAAVVEKVVAAADGSYKFANLVDGTYYVSAKYNTANMNNMKAGSVWFATASDATVTLAGAAAAQDLALVSHNSTGTAVIDMNAGWVFDATHSTTEFEFDYDAANAIFSGIFATQDFKNADGVDNNFKFDEATPANTSFTARIALASIQTGAPTTQDPITNKVTGGRDGVGGCTNSTFGYKPAVGDTLNVYARTWNPASTNQTGYAYLTSKSVTAYGDGYKAVCDLTFHQLTKEVTLYFHYIEGYSKANTDGTTSFLSSLQGWFVMDALGDFNIVSGHVGDKPVTVNVSLQFNKKI